MRAYLLLNVAVIAGLTSLPRALAWGAAGHEIIATIAQSYLEPQALDAVCSILASDANSGVRGDAPCYLSTVASWADKIRFHARWTAPLHYIGAFDDNPPDYCLFPGAYGWRGSPRANVLDAIQNVTSILADFANDFHAGERAQEALKFLIHFVGDMHQPLHLTGRDRGGSDVIVSFNGRHTNLHSVWDTALIAKSLRTIPRNYTRPLPVLSLESSLQGRNYDPYVRRILWEGIGVGRDTGRWEDEADSWLACPASSPDGPQLSLAAPRRPSRGWGEGPPLTSDSGILCPYAWAAPIHQLNCDIVWPADLALSARVNDDARTHARGNHDCGSDESEDEERAWAEAVKSNYLELDTPEYAGRIEDEWVVEKLLAQGGVRLAGILNALFSSL